MISLSTPVPWDLTLHNLHYRQYLPLRAAPTVTVESEGFVATVERLMRPYLRPLALEGWRRRRMASWEAPSTKNSRDDAAAPSFAS